jgi:hypothetical protein
MEDKAPKTVWLATGEFQLTSVEETAARTTRSGHWTDLLCWKTANFTDDWHGPSMVVAVPDSDFIVHDVRLSDA